MTDATTTGEILVQDAMGRVRTSSESSFSEREVEPPYRKRRQAAALQKGSTAALPPAWQGFLIFQSPLTLTLGACVRRALGERLVCDCVGQHGFSGRDSSQACTFLPPAPVAPSGCFRVVFAGRAAGPQRYRLAGDPGESGNRSRRRAFRNGRRGGGVARSSGRFCVARPTRGFAESLGS